jgi:hypothetical protein
MLGHKQKNFRLRATIVADFEKTASILGLHEYEAAEMALQEWIRSHHDEAQKRLDLYAEKGVTIIEPEHLEIKIFQRVDIFLAKEELTKRINNLDRGTPEYRKELQLELAESLHKLRPICVQNRDPELLQLIRNAEKRLGSL